MLLNTLVVSTVSGGVAVRKVDQLCTASGIHQAAFAKRHSPSGISIAIHTRKGNRR